MMVEFASGSGVLLLDMDHFKAVNDEYGHDIGDKVLKELARILNETIRESDIIIRYGGEEFIVFSILHLPPSIYLYSCTIFSINIFALSSHVSHGMASDLGC